ncbi:hypothetical protein F3Y22_tig00006230pilonHSYRG00002 [Hibiscus syriacus]|uniref:Uncharacterized protein n=1 Tax=Hibiscus syriacus TaxID=106335 RepID=A0A6A3CH20_HIBSY|nr:acetylserotonin O-methyltransferase-like [Hibiscus syriacus]KAE8726761.1 hypothetical protein F3Y22_tig00006230pilonHSYRG00002 [Hibiscus syriacus]
MANSLMSAILKDAPKCLMALKVWFMLVEEMEPLLSMLVKAFPWIHRVNFDLPHVVAIAPKVDGIEHVESNMFKYENFGSFNSASQYTNLSVYMCMFLNCIIVQTVVKEDKDEKLVCEVDVGHGDDAHTSKGKERTLKQWEYVLGEAGFTRFSVKRICAVQSVIEAYV